GFGEGDGNIVAEFLVIGSIMSIREQRGDIVPPIMVCGLKLHESYRIRCGLRPFTTTAHEIQPLTQEIRARRFPYKSRSQNLSQELVGFAIFSLCDENMT